MPCNWKSEFNYTPFKNFSDEDVIPLMNKVFFHVVHKTTYKFAFFKSIIDNLFNVNLDTYFLSYDALSLSFTEIYWNLILCHGLKQIQKNQNAEVEGKLFEFCQQNDLLYDPEHKIYFELLPDEDKLKISKMIKDTMKRNVVGALCGDTDDQFYHFDKKNMDGISLNPDIYKVLLKYKCSFEKLNYYAWIKFLEEVNKEEDSYALATKLDSSTERKNLTPYRNILLDFGQTTCFYCGKKLSDKTMNTHVDHFIPWSYVKDDKIWNFVLACNTCNTNKSNNLPYKYFLKDIDNRNNHLKNYDSDIVHEDFKTYSFDQLYRMYKFALSNGFTEWKMPNFKAQ